jgi:hypothetical protein
MKKNVQKTIPVVSTEKWKHLPKNELVKNAYDLYVSKLSGKEVINADLGIAVKFTKWTAKKTTKGSALYYKKAAVIEVLGDLVQYAEFSNWGNRKNSDKDSVIGYLNMKVKVEIDGILEHIHLVIQVKNNGKFQYTMEVNKKNR